MLVIDDSASRTCARTPVGHEISVLFSTARSSARFVTVRPAGLGFLVDDIRAARRGSWRIFWLRPVSDAAGRANRSGCLIKLNVLEFFAGEPKAILRCRLERRRELAQELGVS